MKFNKQISKLLAKLMFSSLAISSVGCVQVSAMEQKTPYEHLMDRLMRSIKTDNPNLKVIPDNIKASIEANLTNYNSSQKDTDLLWLMREVVYCAGILEGAETPKFLDDIDFRWFVTSGGDESCDYADSRTDGIRPTISLSRYDELLKQNRQLLDRLVESSQNRECRIQLLHLLNFCIVKHQYTHDIKKIFDEYEAFLRNPWNYYWDEDVSVPIKDAEYENPILRDMRQNSQDPDVCSICLDNLLREYPKHSYQKTPVIARCGHVFHRKCIEAWLNTNPNCPFCRQVILMEPRDLNERSRTPNKRK